MKADTVLEYVEFQLSTHRNRCELFVSGGGVTEKLASGFLKPFLIHLRALKDQITSQTGCESVIRLDHPQNSNINATSWFTKGILDRFVRFVSTPEVLERVRSIEDELAQLEQVRSIQVATLVQDGGTSFGAYPGFTNNDSTAMPKDNGTCKLSKGYSHRAIDSIAAASKMELLEAMDIRLRALKQEQDTYFSRAAVAGFDSENMAGLVAFSEHFGAERLRAACLNFLEVLQKRHLERLELDSEGISSNSATAMTNAPGNPFTMEMKSCLPFDKKISQGLRQDGRDGSGDVGGDKNCPTQEKGSDLDRSLSKASVTVEGRKRWGPPENICRKVFLEQNETDSMASNDTSGGITLEDIASDAQSHSIPQQAHDLQKDLRERRRNSCLTEKSTPDHKNNVECQGKPHKQNSIVDEPTSEKHKNNENGTASVIEHARRLSVQDAISLFEKNQRRDSTDTGGKSSGGKVERSRVSLEGSNTSLSAEMATRRRSTLGGLETTVKTQENHILTENESSFSMQNALLNPEGASHPAHPPGNSSDQSSESDWRKQFKLQLERTLSKELLTNDVAIKQDTFKSELGDGVPQNSVNANLQAASTSPTSSRTGTSLHSTSTARHGVTAELREPPPLMQDNTPVNSDHIMERLDSRHMQRTFDSDSCVSTAKNEVGNQEDEIFKPVHDSNGGNHLDKERESLSETSADSLHPDIKALAEIVENHTVENDNDSCGLRGRYYEQYTRLRDAKLMEGQDTKRAERDAKLRSMEETLIKRKAEMDAQAARLSRNVNNQSRILKLQALKSDHSLKLDQKDVDSECGTLTSRDQRNSGSGSRSPPVTPYAIKEEITTSRPQVDRKSGTAQKAIAHPHTSTRSNQSISPKLTRKGTTGAMAIPRRSTVSSPIENPLARSVPNLNLTNLKKNTKPSTGRQSGSARVHPKNGANEGDRSAREAIHSDINANHSTNTSDRSTKNDKNSNRSNLMRKSCVMASDLKVLSTSSDDATLRHVKSQRDFGTDPKLRRSGIGSFQESKQFLRKGSSVGQGAKSGVTNNKVHSAVTDAVKSSNEGETTIEIKQQSIATDRAHNMNNPGDLGDTEVENMETDATNDADASPDSASSDDVEMQVVDSGNDSSDEPEEKPEMPSYPLVIGLLEEKTLSKDIFSSEGTCHDSTTNLDTNSMLDMGGLGLRHEEDLAVKSPKRETTVNDATHDTAFQNFTCIPKVPESPPTSGLVRSRTGSGHMSPFSAASLDSPIRSPTNSFQTQYASGSDSIQLNKKWVGSPKSLSTLKQPKEQAKGFKRLLKFGRKSRNFEAASADYVSTISEGSCALEEKGQTPDEYSTNGGRFQDSTKMAGDLYNLQDRSFQNVKSSIPIPPANFSLREDHLSGGTMLKAPWSFFSLSALRNKGNESKPR